MEFHPKTEFRIESPSGKSRSFRIRYKSPDTQAKWQILKLPEIDTINSLFISGSVDLEHSKNKLKKILQNLYSERDKTKKKAPFASHNLALVDRFWEEKYHARRIKKMKQPQESLNDLKKAAEAVGMFPIDASTPIQLEEAVEKSVGSKKHLIQRRIIWLNSIRSWLNLEKLEVPRKKKRENVTYLTEAEFIQLRDALETDFDKALASIAFYTGLRLGEIFGLKDHNIKVGSIRVEGQLTDSLKYDSTKTDSERDAFLPESCKEYIEYWLGIPLEEKKSKRNRNYSKIIRSRCQKLFPAKPDKDCSFHALRHSNAIWLLQKGATIVEVAQHLGNHVTVTERFYSGFILKKESLDRLSRLVNTEE